jgi:4'-phosphopantetheinyl transferase
MIDTPASPPRASVYIADARLLDAESPDQPKLVEELTSSQREELTTIASPKRRRQFLASRVLVRQALFAWAGRTTETWTLAAEASGRPYLQSRSRDSAPPAISLSHSGTYILCALCDQGRIGIDVEEIRPRDIDGLAREALAESELAQLGSGAGARLQSFYQLWTLKEACSKALGTGLATPFRQLVFDLQAPRIRFRSAKPAERAEFVSFVPAPGAIAALALLLPPTSDASTVRFYFMTALDSMDVARPEILCRTSAIDSVAG